jgi:hypothetical protein
MNTENTIINCDVIPFCPEGWEIVEHRKCGQIEWDPTAWDPRSGNLYLSDIQKNNKADDCMNIYNEIQDKPVLNACVIDFLLANPQFAPAIWGDFGYSVLFWGTIYRCPKGDLCVRYVDVSCNRSRCVSSDFITLKSRLNGPRTPAALIVR